MIRYELFDGKVAEPISEAKFKELKELDEALYGTAYIHVSSDYKTYTLLNCKNIRVSQNTIKDYPVDLNEFSIKHYVAKTREFIKNLKPA